MKKMSIQIKYDTAKELKTLFPMYSYNGALARLLFEYNKIKDEGLTKKQILSFIESRMTYVETRIVDRLKKEGVM